MSAVSVINLVSHTGGIFFHPMVIHMVSLNSRMYLGQIWKNFGYPDSRRISSLAYINRMYLRNTPNC